MDEGSRPLTASAKMLAASVARLRCEASHATRSAAQKLGQLGQRSAGFAPANRPAICSGRSTSAMSASIIVRTGPGTPPDAIACSRRTCSIRSLRFAANVSTSLACFGGSPWRAAARPSRTGGADSSAFAPAGCSGEMATFSARSSSIPASSNCSRFKCASIGASGGQPSLVVALRPSQSDAALPKRRTS